MKKIFKKELEKDLVFVNNVLDTFVKKLTSMSEQKHHMENFPSNNRIKKIKGGLDCRVDILQQLMLTCDLLEERRSKIFFKVAKSIKELEGPFVIQNSEIISREEFESGLKVIKTTLRVEFNGLTYILKKEIRIWLIDFVVEDSKHHASTQEDQAELSMVESEMFLVKVKEEVIVGPLEDYIRIWVTNVVEATPNIFGSGFDKVRGDMQSETIV